MPQFENQFGNVMVTRAYLTLFEGGAKKPEHIIGALYALLNRAETDPEADELLTRAKHAGLFGPGKALKSYRALRERQRIAAQRELDQRRAERAALEAQRLEARKAKQQRGAANRQARGQADAAKKGPSGGGKNQDQGKKKGR